MVHNFKTSTLPLEPTLLYTDIHKLLRLCVLPRLRASSGLDDGNQSCYLSHPRISRPYIHIQLQIAYQHHTAMSHVSQCRQKILAFMCVNCTEANERIYPTNKTQVFNEISIIENWFIIHVINSPSLCYTRGISTLYNLEDSSCVQHG